MSFLTTYFVHARAVHAAAAAAGLVAVTQNENFALRLEGGEQSAVWPAKFVVSVAGRLAYSATFGRSTVGFAGWMPYAARQWPIALDKAAFKRFAADNGIATPAACVDPSQIQGPFIIKKGDSSFGEGMRGPFLRDDRDDPDQALGEGEFYENFIVGLIAKAWCWNGECFAIHLHRPSLVVGDGTSSVRELVTALPNARGGENDWGLIARLAAYCGVSSLDSVVPHGKEVLIEYRYGSRYEPFAMQNENVLGQIRHSDLGFQFQRAATVLADGISAHTGDRRAVYTLDAMVDGEGTACFLEMNCNPLVHPDLYGGMVEGLATRR